MAALMALMDITIVNVALNDIRASFATPIDQIGWVSTGYMMANIVVIPMTGWFQRRFGIRRYFAGSILLFTVASALCAVSWNLPSLAAFRALQGLGGGAIIPTTQTILFSRYPREQHGLAGAFVGIGGVTGPLLGPTIGGYLTNWANWHWIFLINLPLGLLATWMAARVIEEPGFSPAKEPIDLPGIALLTVGLATLQYVLEEGNRDGWFESKTICVLGAISVIALISFVVHALETRHPIADLRIFKNRTYSAATGVNFLVGLALFSGNFLFSLFCGAVMHYNALQIGRVFLVSGLVSIPMLPFVGKFFGRLDPRPLLIVGVTGMLLSLWMNAHLTRQADFGDLVMPMMIRALALAFIFVPINTAALSDVPNHLRGNAAGLFNATRELGGSIGTAWMGFVIERGTVIYGSHLRDNIYPSNPWVQEAMGAAQSTLGGQTWTRDLVGEYVLQQRVRLEASVLSFNHGFALAAVVVLSAYVMLLMLKRRRPGDVPPEGGH
jgi:DHA2 family multidrug resistance protein